MLRIRDSVFRVSPAYSPRSPRLDPENPRLSARDRLDPRCSTEGYRAADRTTSFAGTHRDKASMPVNEGAGIKNLR